MKHLNKFLITVFSILFLGNTNAQGVAIGEWRDHLSYNYCVAVTEGENNLIYCASRYNVFSYNKDDHSIQLFSKTNGLSDVGISTIRYYKQLHMLLIAYSNANIDIIENNQVTNIPDIKRKNIPGGKKINHILFLNNYAYLSCSFGIVVVDLAHKEIKDTYYIGPFGSHIEVCGLAYNGTDFFAATESGIFQASASSSNLADFQEWTKHTGIPLHSNDKFNSIVSFHDKIIANSSSNVINTDTLFAYDGSSWSIYLPSLSCTKRSLESMYGMLVVAGFYEVNVYDSTTACKVHRSYPYPNHAIVTADTTMWFADTDNGLVRNWAGWISQSIIPNGPVSSYVFNMSVEDSRLWIASGGHDDAWNNMYLKNGISSFINGKWSSYYGANVPALDTIFDICYIIVNPKNPSMTYAASWGRGLIEFTDSVITNIFNNANSSLDSLTGVPGYYWLGVGGMAFDDDGNLWMANSGSNKALSVKKADNTWKSFDFSGLVNNNVIGGILIDKSNQKWIILPKNNGLIVFNDNNTIDIVGDDQKKKLSNSAGYGGLPSNNVLSLALDQDGEVWAGTDLGVVVFYSPENVFSGNNFDAQYITLMQDGHAQHLLETESVNAIAIDGANQKWLGTQNAGAFLMSPDGTTEILHFTEDNSPLLSNTITSIAIDQKTGEVFFGTDKGIISYKGEATAGGDVFTDVYAFPNPVREDYTGLIGIKGLTTNATVKITDIAGNVVYETIAKGGQAIWNGKNFNGERAKTGVYLVFCASQDGAEKVVTKIMIIN
jgi:hypothetical protein